MTVPQAFALALKNSQGGELTTAEYEQIERTLYAAGWCPSCATSCEPARHRLGDHEPATYEAFGGRECTVCEEFFPDPGQPARLEDPAEDYGGVLAGDGSVYSDADSGL